MIKEQHTSIILCKFDLRKWVDFDSENKFPDMFRTALSIC